MGRRKKTPCEFCKVPIADKHLGRHEKRCSQFGKVHDFLAFWNAKPETKLSMEKYGVDAYLLSSHLVFLRGNNFNVAKTVRRIIKKPIPEGTIFCGNCTTLNCGDPCWCCTDENEGRAFWQQGRKRQMLRFGDG